MVITIGIDPGLSGAIAILSNKEVLSIIDIKKERLRKSKKKQLRKKYLKKNVHVKRN